MSTEKPNKPSFSPNTNRLTDGRYIMLTCASSSHSVNKYEFFKNGHSLGGAGSGNTYELHQKAGYTNAGSYSCKAYIDTVASDTSSSVNGKVRRVNYLKLAMKDIYIPYILAYITFFFTYYGMPHFLPRVIHAYHKE